MEVVEAAGAAAAALLSRPPLLLPRSSPPFMAWAVTCSLVDVMPRYKSSLLLDTAKVGEEHHHLDIDKLVNCAAHCMITNSCFGCIRPAAQPALRKSKAGGEQKQVVSFTYCDFRAPGLVID